MPPVVVGTFRGPGRPGNRGRILKSEDFGTTWEDCNLPDEELYQNRSCHGLDYIGGGIVVVGTEFIRNFEGRPYDAIHKCRARSPDKGVSWEALCSCNAKWPFQVHWGGGANYELWTQCVRRLDNGDTLLGTGGCEKAHVMRSDRGDDGACGTWYDIGVITVGGFPQDRIVHYMCDLGGGIVLAGTTPWQGGILRSDNYGATWQRVAESPKNFVESRDAIHLGGGVVLAGICGTYNAAIWRSLDWGVTWTVLGYFAYPLPHSWMAVDSLLYLGGDVVLCTLGITSAKIEPTFQIAAIMRSEDAGLSWHTVHFTGLNPCDYNMWLAEASMGDGGVLCGSNLPGIYRSYDLGLTWDIIPGAPGIRRFTRVDVEPPAPVGPQATVTLTAVPDTIPTPGPVDLVWTSTNAAGVVIIPDVGEVALNGTRVVELSRSQTFTIVAYSPGGSAHATVNVTVEGKAPPGSPGPPYDWDDLCGPHLYLDDWPDPHGAVGMVIV